MSKRLYVVLINHSIVMNHCRRSFLVKADTSTDAILQAVAVQDSNIYHVEAIPIDYDLRDLMKEE